jgi:CSLREA domain-containing protein
MNNNDGRLKVFIIDDDLAIRQCLKILLTSLYGDKFDIYSSGDGVEGLGMLYILNPDLIIIDTTLPTYSGRELIDYVTSNGRFTNTKLIVVDDRGNLVPGLNPNIKILSKQNPNFVKDLETNVRETLGPGETKRGLLGKIKNFFIRKTLAWANRSDLVMFNISKDRKGGVFSFLKTFILFPLWVIAQILTSLGLAFLYLFTSGKIKDANIPQAVSDNKAFRVLAYPTLIGVLTAAVFFIIQIALFIGGGIVIFNSVRLESIFANNGAEVSLNFNTATYDSNLIELVEGRLRLKEQFTSVEIEESAPAVFTEEPTPEESVLNQQESETPTEPEPEVIEPTEPVNEESAPEVVQPVENTEDDSNGEVQGIVDAAEVVGVSAETVSTGYSTANPVITFSESIEFSNLIRIEEVSSINFAGESTPSINSGDPKRRDLSIEDLKNRILPSNTVTYQLSPNDLDWYYFNAGNVIDSDINEGWEKTEQGFVSSNTVQEVNQYLSNYLEAVGGNTLYLRVYLHSDGETQVALNEIRVIREQAIVTLLNEEVPDDLNPTQESISFPVSLPEVENINTSETVVPELPVPTIFQATYVDGNKVVYGKLLGANIPDIELSNIKVNVYYTLSTDITKTAENKIEFIGESSLSRNESGDLTFLLITPNREGGFVTADLVYTINGTEVNSILSKPLENSTFTVDSTADTADHTLNGICSAGTATGGVCTLRAAIAEANNVVGADNIYFNIPTSDAGYRDYDAPDSPSSGDGVGGDDYWTIRPATNLPSLSEATVLDGSTQELSQTDFNSFGPDIEIRGGPSGPAITLNSTNIAIHKVVINTYATYGIANTVNVVISNFVLTSSFIGVDTKSYTDKTSGTVGFWCGGGASSGIIIGNDTSDGNVFAGAGSGIDIGCSDPSGNPSFIIRGNRFGLSFDGTVKVGNTANGLISTAAGIVEVGGPLESHRNYFGGNNRGINLQGLAGSGQLLIRNNFFGTDLSGTVNMSNVAAIRGDTNGTNVAIPNNAVIVSDNLFRFSTSDGFRIEANKRVDIFRNTFADNSRAITIGNDDNASFEQNQVEIYNNFIGASESDPYFNLNVGSNTTGIYNRSSSPVIKGNIIQNNSRIGISNITETSHSRITRQNHYISRPTIGGSSAFAESLCNGTEKNCISNNFWGGVVSSDTIPLNESTLWSDNNYDGGNGSNGVVNIEQIWLGLFEIASSNYRRTDLTGIALNFPISTKVRTTDDPSTVVTSATAINVTCLGTSGVSCPTAGHTTGTLDNTYLVVPTGQTATALSNTNNWFRVTEYIYDANGVKTDYSSFKFDQPHFSSPTFTFDGDSTDNVINTGTSRVIDTQTYTDRGEPWTDKPLATRNIATGDIGRFQIMEVEYVDANPILQEDGSYVITVDSTEESAIATGTTYSDDGTGTASGGMSKLATAVLSNGNTSLREAVTVANNRSGLDKVHFNIPETDANYTAPSGSVQGYFTISPVSTTITSSDASGIYIDGYTQPGTSRNTTPFGGTIDTVLKVRISTTTISGLTFTTGNNHVTGLNFISTTGGNLNFNSTNNNWIEGNFFGSTIDGTAGVGNSNYVGIVQSDNIIIGTNGDGTGDIGERNLFMGGASQYKVAIQAATTNMVIAGNYMGVDKTSRVCSAGTQGRSQIAALTNVSSSNNRIGTNFDGVSDSEEANILACVNAAGTARAEIQLGFNMLIQGNYIGTNTYGDNLLSSFLEPGIRDNSAGSNNIIKSNTIMFNGYPGIVFRQGSIGNTFALNKILGNGGIDIDLDNRAANSGSNYGDGLSVNDSGDSDTGPNHMMNFPEIHRVTYLSGGKYKVEGILDNNVSGEGPFDIEVCLSDNHSSGHGGCTQSLGFFENVLPQVSGGLNPWSVEVTVAGDNGTQDHIFTSLATNNLGSTSEFSENFNTENNPNFSLASFPITLTEPSNNRETSDASPLLNWNDSGDLDLKHYEIYINGVFYALVPANQTDLQIPYELPAGTYSWQVVGVRNNNTESGRGGTNTFTVTVPGVPLPVSSPILEPITPLPPVSFIPREDDIITDIDNPYMQQTILTTALCITTLALSAGAIVFIRRKWFNGN